MGVGGDTLDIVAGGVVEAVGGQEAAGVWVRLAAGEEPERLTALTIGNRYHLPVAVLLSEHGPALVLRVSLSGYVTNDHRAGVLAFDDYVLNPSEPQKG